MPFLKNLAVMTMMMNYRTLSHIRAGVTVEESYFNEVLEISANDLDNEWWLLFFIVKEWSMEEFLEFFYIYFLNICNIFLKVVYNPIPYFVAKNMPKLSRSIRGNKYTVTIINVIVAATLLIYVWFREGGWWIYFMLCSHLALSTEKSNKNVSGYLSGSPVAMYWIVM